MITNDHIKQLFYVVIHVDFYPENSGNLGERSERLAVVKCGIFWNTS